MRKKMKGNEGREKEEREKRKTGRKKRIRDLETGELRSKNMYYSPEFNNKKLSKAFNFNFSQ